jgi:hypothetical protein
MGLAEIVFIQTNIYICAAHLKFACMACTKVLPFGSGGHLTIKTEQSSLQNGSCSLPHCHRFMWADAVREWLPQSIQPSPSDLWVVSSAQEFQKLAQKGIPTGRVRASTRLEALSACLYRL